MRPKKPLPASERLEGERARAEQVAKAASEHGVDAALLARMSGDVEENALFLKQQLAAMPKYPTLTNDRGDPKPPAISKDAILGIQDPAERLQAIAANKELFDS